MSFVALAAIIITVILAALCANDYAKALRRGASEHDIRALIFWYCTLWLGSVGGVLLGSRSPLNQHRYTHWFTTFSVMFALVCFGRIRAHTPKRPNRART